MDIKRKKKLAARAYEPFFLEALHNLIITTIVVLLITISLVIICKGKNVSALIFILPILLLYITLELVFTYKTCILALLERKKSLWEEKTVVIKKIVAFRSGADPMMDSAMSKIYPKKMSVDRYKVICETEEGDKLVLKTVLSFRKYWLFFSALSKQKELKCKFYYGKYSKIIMYCKGNGELFDKMNYML